MSVQYVSDEAGNRTAVLVPIAEWERLQQQPPAEAVAATTKASVRVQLSKKEQFKEEFREAVRDMKAGKGRPFREFLAELDELPTKDH